MLYKIEFLTIENMHFKRDFEIFRFNDWRSAVNRFIKFDKFYFPIYIFDVLEMCWKDSRTGKVYWRSVFCDQEDEGEQLGRIHSLNVDLGFATDYNESEDFSSNS